ncbi:MAG: RNA polymerase sigma-70 factor (ECF subfamily) [Cyclobacteriaceae bacterium]|jgi:RNA polymerase sigma-70 factor (ECF subfamily)
MGYDSDRALARDLMTGDERVFDRFFNEYFPRLYRFALTRMASDVDAVNDIVQTTLFNGIKAMASYRGEASLFTWLCQICRNEVNGYYRRLSRSVPVVAQDDDAIRPILESLEGDLSLDPDREYEVTQTKHLVQEVLDCLPVNYGNALEWKYIEGFSVTEIASRLQVTELAAQSLLSRARSAFREALVKLSPQMATGR